MLEPAVSGFLSCFLFCGFSLPWRKAFLCPPHRGDIFDICSLLGFPCGSAGKESTCNVGDLGSIPGLEFQVQFLVKGKATHSSILT